MKFLFIMMISFSAITASAASLALEDTVSHPSVTSIEEWAANQLAADLSPSDSHAEKVQKHNKRSCIKNCRTSYPLRIDFPSFTSNESRRQQTDEQRLERAGCMRECKDNI